MRWWGRIFCAIIVIFLWLILTIIFIPSDAQAETWNHRAYASLSKNSPSKAKYVQGVAYDGNKYAYVVKQNSSKHQSLWRVNMNKGGSATKMKLSAKTKKLIHHGNDLECLKIGKVQYLLVAPCKNHNKYLRIFKIKGKNCSYIKSIKFNFLPKVSAITVVSHKGTIVKCIIGKGKKLWMAKFDLIKRKTVKNLGRVYGYCSNQGISYKDGYLLSCDGGYKTRLGNVRKYKVVKSGKHWNLRKVWTRQIKGECEGAFYDRTGKICIAMEGKWHWGYSDRIVRWSR